MEGGIPGLHLVHHIILEGAIINNIHKLYGTSDIWIGALSITIIDRGLGKAL